MSDKSVLVIGLGRSGVAAASLLAQRGAHVIGVDNADSDALQDSAPMLRARGVDVRLGVQKLGQMPVELAVLSPGIPADNALVREVELARIPLISEVELGFRFCTCPVVAITGTNGKTTTTQLCESVLAAGGKRTTAAGNIGLAFCEALSAGPMDVAVVEASSFQLERIERFRPRVSVMLNVTPDHLDRYASMREYTAAKERIFSNQQPGDWAIVNDDCRDLFASLKRANGPRQIFFSTRGRRADNTYWLMGTKICSEAGELLDVGNTHLRGPHNAQNIMAALGVAEAFDVPLPAAREAIAAYRPLPHRCEFVAEIDGVRYINDSKATNVDAVEQALAGFREPVILIAGGKDKGFDFAALNETLRGKVKLAVLIGGTREKLARCWSPVVRCELAGSLAEAVAMARRGSQSGDVVLLSPACSSFDMFEDYEDRGDQFKQIVRSLRPQ